MIFTKISVIVLLVLSEICASESRRHEMKRKKKDCRYTERIEQSSTEYSPKDNSINHIDNIKDGNDGKISNPENVLDKDEDTSLKLSFRSDSDTTLNNADDPLAVSLDISGLISNIYPTHTYISQQGTNQANMSPVQAAEWLKKMWLKYHRRKPLISSLYDKHTNQYATGQINSIPLYEKVIPRENYQEISPNNFINKPGGIKDLNKFDAAGILVDNYKENTHYQDKINSDIDETASTLFHAKIIPQEDYLHISHINKNDDKNDLTDSKSGSGPIFIDYQKNNGIKQNYPFGSKYNLNNIARNNLAKIPNMLTFSPEIVLMGRPEEKIKEASNLDYHPYITDLHSHKIDITKYINTIDDGETIDANMSADPNIALGLKYSSTANSLYPPLTRIAQSQFDLNKLNKSNSTKVTPPYTAQFWRILSRNDLKRTQENRYYIPATHIAPTRIPSVKPASGIFSKWVKDQMDLLNNQNHGPDKLNLSSLGYSVLQVLTDNGMYITDNGMLIDTYGTVSSIETLTLTPLIIGDTMSLKNLLQGKHNIKSTKLGTPYIQAILVTATHPLKVLGIVPLGIIHLPLSTLGSSINMPSSESGKFDTTKAKEEQKKQVEPKEEHHDYGGTKHNSPKDWLIQNLDYTSGNRFYLDGYGRNDHEQLAYSKNKYSSKLDDEEAGRVFLPKIEFYDHPIDILSSRILSLQNKPALINVPDVPDLFNDAFESPGMPAKIGSSLNADITSKPASITNFLEKINKPAEVSFQNIKLMDKYMPLIGEKNSVSTRRYEKPVQNWSVRKENPISLNYRLHSKPNAYSDKSDFNIIPGFKVSLAEKTISRSADNEPVVPLIPSEVGNGNNPYDLIENEDDEGNYRIIGGNAATGSGTPLSNKGRSGRVF